MAEGGLWKAPSQSTVGMWPGRPCGSWHKPWAPCFRTPSLSSSIWTPPARCFGLESRGASREEMSQALDSAVQVCGVGPLLDRNIFALSGGEKQRIACASAWAMGPEVFVLDEPSSNLDGEGIRQLRDILRRLKAAGKPSWWRSTDCGTLPTWLTECFICGEGGWSGSTPGRVPGFDGRETALHGSAEFDGGAAA